MYRKILICLDNSDSSIAGAGIGVAIAKNNGAALTGLHVYAAKLHNSRFREMEGVLPPEYRGEEELKKQRKTHDDLITRGLRTISDSYIEVLAEKARAAGVKMEGRSREGKNFEEIVREAEEGGYDLVIMGAHGLGWTERSRIGSVAERVARRVRTDILIVKDSSFPYKIDGPVVAAIDESPSSYGAMRAAVFLSLVFKTRLEAISVFDPDFHYRAFRSIEGVLSSESGSIFRFKEQEKLHGEIIDKGLERLYGGYLESASAVAKKGGGKAETKLLSGKPFDEITAHVERVSAFMLVAGRTGAHSTEGLDIGSTAENCLRESPSNVLLTNREFNAPRAREGESRFGWSPEALEIMSRIPPFARGVAMNIVEDAAAREGVKEITAEFMRKVRKDIF